MLAQIQSYVRTLVCRQRDVLRVGPFLATFDRHSSSPYLSYALPDAGALPTAGDVQALIDAYLERGRVPRFEYLPDLAPAVQQALSAAGFTEELRTTVMTVTSGEVVAQEPPAGIDVVRAATDADLADVLRIQYAAFGGHLADVRADEVARTRGDGTLAVLARDSASGQPVGAASATAVVQAVSELGGFAVIKAYRGRGIAAALTWRLTELVGEAGAAVPFVSPGNEQAERVYRRAGYRPVGDMLHLSLLA